MACPRAVDGNRLPLLFGQHAQVGGDLSASCGRSTGFAGAPAGRSGARQGQQDVGQAARRSASSSMLPMIAAGGRPVAVSPQPYFADAPDGGAVASGARATRLR